jgi:DNA-binding response OmpR family regulator
MRLNMISFFTKPNKAVVFVVEPNVALRSVVVDALRQQGFERIRGFGDLKTMLDAQVSEKADWILSASFTSNDINLMHLLNLCIEDPEMRSCRVSFLMREHEKDLLALAFEIGLLSYHLTNIPSRIPDEFSDLMRVLKSVGYNGTLAAQNFLQRFLKESRRWDELIRLEKTLLEIFPGSPQILLPLAEAELCAGREEGHQTLQQVLLVDPDMKEVVARLCQQFSVQETIDLPIELSLISDFSSTNNVLNLKSCMLIDSDTAVHHAVRQALRLAGVDNLEGFETGLGAWNALKNGSSPSLILMEWRIPELNGLQLIQRISHAYPGVPIVLLSSLITQAEMPLLRELGASWVVEKPFELTNLMSKIVTAVQQHRNPTEKQALERRIIHFLKAGDMVAANQLFVVYQSNYDSNEAGNLRLKAEFAYAEERYEEACTHAYAALKQSDDSVDLLNLLAKSLMKLGDFENAFRLLEKANTLAPHNIERICKMAEICVDLGSAKEAEAYLNEAKSIDSNCILVSETEASMAISMGNTERAANAMKNLESLQRIVAYTNNKAIAQIRNGRFERGIKLYETALQSLPEPWSILHDTISFNMALAYIRLVQYDKAQETLCRIKAPPESPTRLKIEALSAKLEHAVRTGSQLNFAQVSTQSSPRQLSSGSGFNFSRQVGSLAPRRGDICCYRIFEAQELASAESRKLLLNMPKLVNTVAMQRDGFPHKLVS